MNYWNSSAISGSSFSMIMVLLSLQSYPIISCLRYINSNEMTPLFYLWFTCRTPNVRKQAWETWGCGMWIIDQIGRPSPRGIFLDGEICVRIVSRNSLPELQHYYYCHGQPVSSSGRSGLGALRPKPEGKVVTQSPQIVESPTTYESEDFRRRKTIVGPDSCSGKRHFYSARPAEG